MYPDEVRTKISCVFYIKNKSVLLFLVEKYIIYTVKAGKTCFISAAFAESILPMQELKQVVISQFGPAQVNPSYLSAASATKGTK